MAAPMFCEASQLQNMAGPFGPPPGGFPWNGLAPDDEPEDVFDDGQTTSSTRPTRPWRDAPTTTARPRRAAPPPMIFGSSTNHDTSLCNLADASMTTTTTTMAMMTTETDERDSHRELASVVTPPVIAKEQHAVSPQSQWGFTSTPGDHHHHHAANTTKTWVSSNCLYSGPEPLEGHVLVLARCRQRSRRRSHHPTSMMMSDNNGGGDQQKFRLSWRSAYYSLSNGGVLRVFRSPEDRAKWTDLGTTCEGLAKWRAPVTDAFIVSAVADLPDADAPTRSSSSSSSSVGGSAASTSLNAEGVASLAQPSVGSETLGSKKRDYCGALRARCAALGPAPLEEDCGDGDNDEESSNSMCTGDGPTRSLVSARSSSLSSSEDDAGAASNPRTPCSGASSSEEPTAPFSLAARGAADTAGATPVCGGAPTFSSVPQSPATAQSTESTAMATSSSTPPRARFSTFDVWLRADIADPNACPVLKFAGDRRHDLRILQEHLVACSERFRVWPPRKPQRSYSHPLFRQHHVPPGAGGAAY